MLPMPSSGVPINPGQLAMISSPKPYGTTPFRAYDPGRGFGGVRGLRGGQGCDCSPTTGCGCTGMSAYVPLRGMGQGVSLDQLVSNTFSWLGGVAQSSLPASAAVPSGVTSFGALFTTVMQYAPYLLIGYLAYKAIK